MFKHTILGMYFVSGSKIYNDGRSREVYFGLGPGRLWMVARSCLDKVSQKHPTVQQVEMAKSYSVDDFLCETTSRPNHALPLHHDLASMRQAFRLRGRSRCLEAKMWKWRYVGGPTL